MQNYITKLEDLVEYNFPFTRIKQVEKELEVMADGEAEEEKKTEEIKDGEEEEKKTIEDKADAMVRKLQ